MLDQLVGLKIPPELIVMLIAALPIAELRVAIPVGIHTFGMPWYWAFFISVIGNMLPVPILLLFFDFYRQDCKHGQTREKAGRLGI